MPERRLAGAILCVLAGSAALACAAAPAPEHAPRQAAAPTRGDLIAGRRLAHDYCGGCHAVDGGRSPLPDAPRFRELFRRYPAGDLGRVLGEGMIGPSSPLEEGRPRRHPRMPAAPLADDQRAELQAYLQYLDDIGRSKRQPRPR